MIHCLLSVKSKYTYKNGKILIASYLVDTAGITSKTEAVDPSESL